MTATDTHHDTEEVETDTREIWPYFYSIAFGALAIVIGWAGVMLHRNAWGFILTLVAAIVILWVLRLLGDWRKIEALQAVPTRLAYRVAIITLLVGLAGQFIGWISGTWLAVIIQSHWFLTFVVGLGILAVASVGLLLAESHAATRATLVCLGFFFVATILLAQSGTSLTHHEEQKVQTEQQEEEQHQDNCAAAIAAHEQDPDLFAEPVGCD